MLKRLAIALLITAQVSPSIPPKSGVRGNSGQSIAEHRQSTSENHAAVPQPAPLVKIDDSGNANQKAADDAGKCQTATPQGWSRADYIALGACVFAGLQVIALIITIGTMVNTGRRQLRAYVVVERGIVANVANPPAERVGERIDTVARILNPQAGPHLQITIKNTGQTPAYNLVHWADVNIREFPLQTQLPTMPKPDRPYWNVLGPTVPEVKTLRMRLLTAEEIEGLQNGTKAIYCNGEIRYKDAFNRNRWTKYRAMYVTPACGIIGIGTDLVYCEEGNEAN